MNDQSISDTIWRSLKTAYTYLLEHRAVLLLLLAGIASIVIRFLLRWEIQNSAVVRSHTISDHTRTACIH